MATEVLPQLGAHFSSPNWVVARHEMRADLQIPPGPDGLSLVLYQSTGVALEPGNRVELVENGRVFDVLVDAIRAAQQSVHLLLYIWRPSEASDRVVEALLERRRAGVAVRVVVDPIGSEEAFGRRDFDLKVEPVLSRAGCEVHFYRLVKGKVMGRMLGRNHQKIAVIDGRVGLTGGFGIWKAWEGDGKAPEEWRDTNVRVEGPCVSRLQLAFSRTWQEAGGGLLGPEDFPRLGEVGSARAGFVASHGRLGITDAERMVRLLIGAARHRLWIANAYFSPPKQVLELLETKRRAGVDVQVLAPGPVHDQRIIRASQRSLYERLLRAGVRIWEYQPSMMHAKTMVVDDWVGVVGSTNLDTLSLNKLGEGSLVVADEAFAAHMASSWQRDVGLSREITLERGGRTGPLKRVARRLTQLLGKDR